MKNRVIRLAHIIVFIALFCGIFYYMQELLKPKWGEGTAGAHETTNAIGFYEEPKNSIDVLLIGSSHIFFGTSPLKMWEAYGFTSYVRGSANQPPLISYYTLKDALISQDPRVVVFEVGRMINQFDPITTDEWVARRGLDYLRLSGVKLEAILDLNLGEESASFVFPFLRYHSRWQELQASDFEYFTWERHNWTKGQYMGTNILEFEWPENYMQESAELYKLPAENIDYFKKIVELCEARDIELVLVKTTSGAWNYAMHNSVQALADDYHIIFIDYCLPENIKETGINTEDFHYNQHHLRITGAEKLSLHLGAFLKEHFQLLDRRMDTAYSQEWNLDCDRYNEFKVQYGIG